MKKSEIKNLLSENKKIISLVIIFLVLVVFLFFFISKPNPNIMTSANQINVLAENIQKFYRNRPDAWGLNTQTMLKNSIVPPEMVAQKNVVNALGKTILVGADIQGNTVMPGNRNYVIVFNDINYDECILLSTSSLSEKNMLSLTSVQIVNEEEHLFSWGSSNSLPITKTEAKKACKKTNVLAWSFFL